MASPFRSHGHRGPPGRTCCASPASWMRTPETALQYGRIKQRLRRRGRPIPENDLWIAATAIQHQLVLASRDDHFTEVEGLTGERW